MGYVGPRDLGGFFLLEPDVVFLNHGSFGACPRPVFESFQRWQLHLERQPVRFLQRELDELLTSVRYDVAAYLGADPTRLHFVRNATVGVNTIARSVVLQTGDEVLTTDHEYGAMDATWEFVCQERGARYVRRAIPLPYVSDDLFVEHLWRGVTASTRVIFLSHITSPTAVRFPVAEVCTRARAEGIITVIDGAHAPGQIPLDLDAVGADFYTGNFHKWLCAPKSAGFMYVSPQLEEQLHPLIVSWGWIDGATPIERFEWRGTDDPAAFLAVPDAIRFQAEHGWDRVRADCHRLAVSARDQLAELPGVRRTSPDDNFAQMFTVVLPECDAAATQQWLMTEHNIEVPVIPWQDTPLLRVSIQGYNTEDDVARLLQALFLQT